MDASHDDHQLGNLQGQEAQHHRVWRVYAPVREPYWRHLAFVLAQRPIATAPQQSSNNTKFNLKKMARNGPFFSYAAVAPTRSLAVEARRPTDTQETSKRNSTASVLAFLQHHIAIHRAALSIGGKTRNFSRLAPFTRSGNKRIDFKLFEMMAIAPQTQVRFATQGSNRLLQAETHRAQQKRARSSPLNSTLRPFSQTSRRP